MTSNGANGHGRPCRIYVLNDHMIFVKALGHYLETYGDIEVVGTGVRGAQAYAEIARLQPSAVVVDPGPGLADIPLTISALRQAAPQAAIIALTQNFDEEYPAAARAAGVAAFIEKLATGDELAATIRKLSADGSAASPVPNTFSADGDRPR